MTKIMFLSFYYLAIYPGSLWMCALALFINYFTDAFSLMVRKFSVSGRHMMIKYNDFDLYSQTSSTLNALPLSRKHGHRHPN